MIDPTGSDGNISADPMYIDTSATDARYWDLRLDESSANIDAGDASLEDPDGSPSDIGAYGGPGAASWDLDGDGHYQWWTPGSHPNADDLASEADCDDLDPLTWDTCYPFRLPALTLLRHVLFEEMGLLRTFVMARAAPAL